MTPHEVQLQLAQIGLIDTNVRKFSKAGIDAVNSALFSDDLFDNTPRFLDALARFSGECDRVLARGYIDDLLKRKLLTVKLEHFLRQIDVDSFARNLLKSFEVVKTYRPT